MAETIAGTPLSDMSLSAVLGRMKLMASVNGEPVPATVHGFRSSFSDWTGETARFPRMFRQIPQ